MAPPSMLGELLGPVTWLRDSAQCELSQQEILLLGMGGYLAAAC